MVYKNFVKMYVHVKNHAVEKGLRNLQLKPYCQAACGSMVWGWARVATF
jgi:hypothetical protein